MEMMLSSAPDIAGCGELTIAGELSQKVRESGKPFDADAAAECAAEFRRLMPPLPESSTAFVDKMPHNYQRLGFIMSAFPNARVINMLRDPRDVGLSKWIRRFHSPGMRYASNLESIAHSANLYRCYLSHWEKLFGDRILTVRYEDLVVDPKTCIQQVAAFCGIDWDERMMTPEKNTNGKSAPPAPIRCARKSQPGQLVAGKRLRIKFSRCWMGWIRRCGPNTGSIDQ